MNAINAFCTTAAEWLMSPLASRPLASLLVCSVITGILMSVVFRFTSNQKALRRVVDRSQAHLLAIKLFKDDLPGMFSSLRHIVWYVGMRLWYSFVPMLVMLVPLTLMLSQLALRYEHRPLAVGESAVVQFQLKQDAWGRYQDLEIAAPSAVNVDTDALRDPAERSIYWRVRATRPELTTLSWQVGTRTVEKQLISAEDNRVHCVSTRRPGPQWWDRALHPGEPGFREDSPVAGIDIHYPRRSTPLLGINAPWWLTFFLVSIAAALLMQPIVKVRF